MAALANARGLPFRRPVLGGSSFSPSALFASGEMGAWLDPSDLSTMFQDSAGTTPAVVDSVVGKVNDKSGRGNHFVQATTSKKPILRLASGKYYLEFDGVDDALDSIAAVNFTGTDKLTVFAGARKAADAAIGLLLESGSAYTSPVGGFFLAAGNGGANYGAGISGTLSGSDNGSSASSFAAPHTAVLTMQADIAGAAAVNELFLRVNAAASFTAAGGPCTGTFNNQVIHFGARGGASTFPFGGNVYSIIIRGAATSAPDIASTEAYVNTKTGAY